MADNGFEYLPDEYSPGLSEADPVATQDALHLPVLPASRADAERIGYGVESVADGDPFADSDTQEANRVHYESLSDSARSAYDLALYGFDGEEQSQESWERSCAGKAEAAHPVEQDSAKAALLEQFNELLAGAHRVRMFQVLEDDRTVTLNEEWDACMREAGYELAWPEYGHDRPDPFYALDLAIRTPRGGVAGEPVPDTPADEIPVDERTLVGSDEERIIALADYDCRTAVNYESRLSEIQIQLENQFVTQHKEPLDQFLAQLEIASQ